MNAMTVFYRSPLHWASINDNEEIASLLIKSGASIDAVDYEGSFLNHDHFDSNMNINHSLFRFRSNSIIFGYHER